MPHLVAGLGVLTNAALTRRRENWANAPDAWRPSEALPSGRHSELDWEPAVKAR